MLKFRHTIPFFAVLAALFFVAGCGGGGGDDSATGSASDSGLANLAAPGSVVFVEGQLQPQGALKQNTDAVAKRFTGEASLHDYIVSKLESSAREDGESLDFASEVEPWLGERGGVAFERVVDGELSEPLIAVQTTNVKAAQGFVDERTTGGKDSAKDVSYGDVDFKVGGAENNALGVIGDALVLADSEKEFKAAVDASEGDSLGGEDRYQETVAAASNASLADAYVDIGAIVEQSEDEVDAPTKEALEGVGIDPNDATAVASVIPQSDRIEVDISSELSGEQAPTGNATKLLGSLPASSFAALAFADFGEQLGEAIDNLDEEGVPPDLEPGELKSTLEQAGIDLDKIAASLGEGAVFAEGENLAGLGGALVVTADSGEAAEAIASLGSLLRAARVPGVSVVSSKASGFSIRSGSLGDKPLVVIGKGDRIAVGYGLAQALTGLNAGSGPALSATPGYKAAVTALGKTPISGYVDGAGALSLAEALVPRSKTDFWEAVPYLKKIGYIGIGTGVNDEVATAKLIAGIGN